MKREFWGAQGRTSDGGSRETDAFLSELRSCLETLSGTSLEKYSTFRAWCLDALSDRAEWKPFRAWVERKGLKQLSVIAGDDRSEKSDAFLDAMQYALFVLGRARKQKNLDIACTHVASCVARVAKAVSEAAVVPVVSVEVDSIDLEDEIRYLKFMWFSVTWDYMETSANASLKTSRKSSGEVFFLAA